MSADVCWRLLRSSEVCRGVLEPTKVCMGFYLLGSAHAY